MCSTEYKYKVDITCEGCVNALKKCLSKTYGQQLVGVEADVSTQIVKVVLNSEKALTYDEVFEAVAKCGKQVTKLS